MCDRCSDLELENAVLRAERDMLLQQREATQQWLQDTLRGSPIDPGGNEATLRSKCEQLVHLFPDKKIQAIKELRTWGAGNGWDMGLKMAKDWMDCSYMAVAGHTVKWPAVPDRIDAHHVSAW